MARPQDPHDWIVSETPFQHARCRESFEQDQVPYWDYDIPGEESEARLKRFGRGLELCSLCVEQDRCYDLAIANLPVVSGVWGNQIFVPMEDRSRFFRCEKCGAPVFGADKRNSIYAGRRFACVKCASK